MQITKINSAMYFIAYNSHFTVSTVINNNYNFG